MASRKSKKLNSSVSYDAIEFFKLTKNKGFLNKIKALRKKYGIDVFELANSIIDGAEELSSEEEIFENLINNHHLQNDVSNLLKVMHLSEGWYSAVLNYLILDTDLILDPKFKPDGIQIHYKLDDDSVEIKLGKDSTLKEIIDRWPSIQKYLNGNRKKKWENFRRDLCIYLAHEKGRSIEEIDREIKEYFDEDLDYGVIKNAISKYKKNMKR